MNYHNEKQQKVKNVIFFTIFFLFNFKIKKNKK